MSAIPKPAAREREARRIDRAPRCANCGKGRGKHLGDARLCSVYGPRGIGSLPNHYHPKRPVPSVRKAPTKPRKNMPKCRHCAHPAKAHHDPISDQDVCSTRCQRCSSCPGYQAARRGSKSSRRAPIVALRKTCNDLWSRCVRARPGGCECPREEHIGVYQGAHGFGKKSYPAVRHDLRNGWKLAAGCHRFYTDHPIEWEDVMRSTRTPEVYAELRAKALAQVKPDLAAVAVELRAELARLGER